MCSCVMLFVSQYFVELFVKCLNNWGKCSPVIRIIVSFTHLTDLLNATMLRVTRITFT